MTNVFAKKDKKKEADCVKCQKYGKKTATGIDRMGFIYYSSKYGFDKEKTIFKGDRYGENCSRRIA